MIRYRAIETHTHTVSSDGDFTPISLLAAAKNDGYEGIILSDHNTDAGWQQIEDCDGQSILPAVRAIEWTTFYGHMLVIGADHFVDWRLADPDHIDPFLKEIQEAGGVAGIAHPFSMGGVLYTGGFFEFHVHEWDRISFIEVWSKARNESLKSNARAREWWMALLNEGHHLAITSGRDWHRPDPEERPFSVTYAGVENGVISSENVKEALRKGRTYVTYGTALQIRVIVNGKEYGLGDTVPAGEGKVMVDLDADARRDIWNKWHYCWDAVRIIADGKAVMRQRWKGRELCFATPVCRWFCVEVRGRRSSLTEETLALSSPVYIS